jgi:hypothetical protein
MKLFKLSGLVAIMCFVMSCSNQASDNNTATEESTTVETEKVESTPPQEYSAPASDADVDDAVKADKSDTAKTSISIGKDGASVKTKKGDGVSYDKEGVKVDRKDVKIDIKRDTN